jgi:hypothetical protein
METQVWLPEELLKYGSVRKVLGLLLKKGARVDGWNYRLYHEEKVADLIRRMDEDPYLVLDNMLPRGFEASVGETPEYIVDRMLTDPFWRGPILDMTLYLRKEMNLQQFLDSYGDKIPDKLTLREYLELAMPW